MLLCFISGLILTAASKGLVNITDATNPIIPDAIACPAAKSLSFLLCSSLPGSERIVAGLRIPARINAIKAAARAIDNSPSGRIDEETTCNVGSFMAPGSTNIVPDKATVIYEVRSLSDEKRKNVSETIIANARKAAEETGAECRTELVEMYTPYILEESDRALIRAMDAAETIGRDGKTKPTSGGSDANNLRRLGIDAITLCIGYENAHSVNERIRKSEMETLVSYISALID